MVLDLDLFREDKGGDPERVRSNVRSRFADIKTVDDVIDLDNTWRKTRHNLDQLKSQKSNF
jgi:seryl-tRNA synthetase